MLRLGVFLAAVAAVLTLFYFGLQARDQTLVSTPADTAPSLSDITFSNIASTTQSVSYQPDTESNKPSPAPLSLSKEPDMVIDAKKQYSATLHTTEGDITVALHAQDTPVTVNNFVTLSQKNFYDNTIFHRVIKGFMIQGGDPLGNGTGGPGYKFNDEPFTGDYVRGAVAMANSGPNSNGSQFFIMQESVGLPKNYVIFGSVTKGMDVVDKIANAAVTVQHGENSKPVKPVSVKSVDVVEQ